MLGYINSIETMGALDGPGLRTVVFLQGCRLRCKFCHNIDSVIPSKGNVYEAQDLVNKILEYKPYWEHYDPEFRSKQSAGISDNHIPGGVTLSGGDPMFQSKFTLEVVKLLKKNNVHIAVESAFYADKSEIDPLLPYVDLWMVSIKHMDKTVHKDLTTKDQGKIFANIKYVDSKLSKGKKIRIRHVVIPTISDTSENLNDLGKFVSKLKNLELLELLPYVTIGRDKWIKMFGHYQLENIKEAKPPHMRKAFKILKKYNISIKH